MLGKFYDDLEIGDTFTSHRRTITETEVVNFICLTGLLNPLFSDIEFAREKGFGARVVPGPLTLSFAIALSDDVCFGTITAVVAFDKVRFTHPVHLGDTIWVRTSIAGKRESKSRPDSGLVTLRHHVYNQSNQQVCSFERTLFFLKHG